MTGDVVIKVHSANVPYREISRTVVPKLHFRNATIARDRRTEEVKDAD